VNQDRKQELIQTLEGIFKAGTPLVLSGPVTSLISIQELRELAKQYGREADIDAYESLQYSNSMS
jgi:hypothetical protein